MWVGLEFNFIDSYSCYYWCFVGDDVGENMEFVYFLIYLWIYRILNGRNFIWEVICFRGMLVFLVFEFRSGFRDLNVGVWEWINMLLLFDKNYINS